MKPLRVLFKLGLALGLAVMMAEVERTPQVPTTAGVEPTVISGMSAADTQIIPNPNGDVVLRVINGSAEACKCTIKVPGLVGGNEVKAKEVSTAAGKTKIIGPFDPKVYNNTKRQLEVTFDKVTTITLEVTRVDY